MKQASEHFVRPESIRRLAEMTGMDESLIRQRLKADPTLIEGEPAEGEELIVVGSVRPSVGSRREVCGRCGGSCWLVDSPVPDATYLCTRCYVRDEAPELAWMLGPEKR